MPTMKTDCLQRRQLLLTATANMKGEKMEIFITMIELLSWVQGGAYRMTSCGLRSGQ